MSDTPPRLRTLTSSDEERAVAELLERAAVIADPGPAQARALAQRISSPSRQRRARAWLAVPALAALVLVTWSALRTRSASPTVEIVAIDEARYSSQPGRIDLVEGGLRVHVPPRAGAGPFVVVTPWGRLIVGAARFEVHALAEATTVDVTEGEVRFELGARTALVVEGKRLRSSELGDVPSLPAPQASQEPRVPGCDATTSDVARCYRQVADGEGMAAGNALFALALRERKAGRHAAAVDALDEYARRFPSGVLAPEAAWVAISELLAAHRFVPALGAVRAFAARFPADQRRSEAALVAAHLLRDQLLSLEEARAEYDHVLALGPSRDVEDEALFYRGVCEQALGERALAKATYELHRSKFPASRFADDEARRLAAVE